MKSIILFSFLLAVACGLSNEDMQKMKAQIMKVGQECQGQTGATAEDISQIMKKTVPSRKEGKCLIACVQKKMGFQDGAGKINVSGVEAWIEQIKKLDADMAGKAKQVSDKCIANVDDSGDECETAGLMFDCYTKEAKAMGFTMMFR